MVLKNVLKTKSVTSTAVSTLLFSVNYTLLSGYKLESWLYQIHPPFLNDQKHIEARSKQFAPPRRHLNHFSLCCISLSGIHKLLPFLAPIDIASHILGLLSIVKTAQYDMVFANFDRKDPQVSNRDQFVVQ